MATTLASCNAAGQDYTTLTRTFRHVDARTLSKVALPYIVRYIVTMEYTEERQRADTSFLVGVNYGRESERERIAKEFRGRADPSMSGIWKEACDLLDSIARGEA